MGVCRWFFLQVCKKSVGWRLSFLRLARVLLLALVTAPSASASPVIHSVSSADVRATEVHVGALSEVDTAGQQGEREGEEYDTHDDHPDG